MIKFTPRLATSLAVLSVLPSFITIILELKSAILGIFLIVLTIVGFLTGLGLAILGMPFAILVGVLTGIFSIVPYIGFYLGLLFALLTGFFTPNVFTSMLKIAGVFLTVQMLEGYLISPKILGDRVGLHPVAVIFSVLIFSRFLGVLGLVIGVPTAAVIKFVLDEWRRHQKWKEDHAEKAGDTDPETKPD